MNILEALRPKPQPITDKGAGTADRYFLPPDYQSCSQANYFDDFGPTAPTVWQPDVYRLADQIGTRIIDVGCGKGLKLRELAKRHEVTGIDFGVNIEFCRRHPFGTWREHDLERPGDLPVQSATYHGAVVICADVIEHLVNPMPLLEKLRKAAKAGATVLLSTPERVLHYGPGHRGPPPNPAHVREWSLGELRQLLEHASLRVMSMGLTADNETDRRIVTSLAVLAA